MPVQNSPVLTPSAGRRGNGRAVNRASNQFDRKLDEILRHAAAIFSSRGYHNASIRDISRATRVSLAGLYYYFSSKEELLYLIQRHAFETILSEARSALEPLRDPVDRLRTFIHLHLNYFINHPNEMTVLTHEDGSLEDQWRREVHAIKKAYFELCLSQVEALKQARKLRRLNTRVSVLSLFGMMNWIYTWYRPRIDPDAGIMAQQMSEIFLRGICGAWARGSEGVANLKTTGARNGSHRNGRRRTAGTRRVRLHS